MQINKIKISEKNIHFKNDQYYFITDKINDDLSLDKVELSFNINPDVVFIKEDYFDYNEEIFQLIPIAKGEILNKVNNFDKIDNLWELNLKIMQVSKNILYKYQKNKINLNLNEIKAIKINFKKYTEVPSTYLSRISHYLNIEIKNKTYLNLMLTLYNPTQSEEKWWINSIDKIQKINWNGIFYIVNDNPSYNKNLKKYEHLVNTEIFSSKINLGRFMKMVSIFDYIKSINGNYIKICDPDDYISYNRFEKFYVDFKKWSNFNQSMIITKGCKIYDNCEELFHLESEQLIEYGKNERFVTTFGNFQIIYIVDKIAKHKLDKKFHHRIKYHDDRLSSMVIAGSESENIHFVNDEFYIQFHQKGISSLRKRIDIWKEQKDLRNIFNFLLDNNYNLCTGWFFLFNNNNNNNNNKLIKRMKKANKNKWYENIWERVESNEKNK